MFYVCQLDRTDVVIRACAACAVSMISVLSKFHIIDSLLDSSEHTLLTLARVWHVLNLMESEVVKLTSCDDLAGFF